MKFSEHLAEHLTLFVNKIREDNLKWREDTFNRVAKLKKQEKKNIAILDGEIKQIKLESEKELEKIELLKNAEISKLKEQLEIEIKQYKEYLSSLEDLKDQLESHFPTTPKPIILIIHNHGTKLLHKMWHSDNWQEYLKNQEKFVGLLTAIMEDTLSLETGRNRPDNALEFIKR